MLFRSLPFKPRRTAAPRRYFQSRNHTVSFRAQCFSFSPLSLSLFAPSHRSFIFLPLFTFTSFFYLASKAPRVLCSVLSLSPFTLTCVTSLLTRPVCAAAIGPRFGDVSRRAGAAAVPPSARSSPASVRAPWQTTSHGCAVTWGCSRCPCFRVKQRVRFY